MYSCDGKAEFSADITPVSSMSHDPSERNLLIFLSSIYHAAYAHPVITNVKKTYIYIFFQKVWEHFYFTRTISWNSV